MQPLEKNRIDRHRLERILIIDDDPVFLHIYRNLLTAHGTSYELVECTDGYAALARMLERTPRLVLLDLSMPRFDGSGFLSIVKSKPELASLPIFVISSDADEARARAGKLENVRWFSKPIRLNTLKHMLQTELSNLTSRPDDIPNAERGLDSCEFDPTHLETYIGGDRVAQVTIAHQFCALSAERLAMLERFIRAPDRVHLRSLAHVLEGSAATLGAQGLLAACRRLRDCLNDGRDDHCIRSESVALSAALRRFTVALAQHFNLSNF